MRLLAVAPVVALLLPCGLHAQELVDAPAFQCLANHPAELQRHLDNNPGALEDALAAKAQLDAHTASFTRERGGGDAYVISVVFHIIHDNGPENISDAQVYDAMRILNEDFNKQNPDWPNVNPAFLDLVGDVGIEFRLARKDPQGNCTNGITRTQSVETNVGDFDMTQLIQWPRNRYMNVWVCAYASGAAGYTYYPMWLDGWPQADGMVVQHSYVGSIGTGSAIRSRVITHEVGHWLNLMHCWGDSNSPGSNDNCFMDDEVEDTPLTRGWTSCVLSGSSCGTGPDNVENYMEYSYCDKMFTHGQGDRMIASLTSPIAQRNQLWQPSTLALTGVAGTPELCEARYSTSADLLCAGGAVQFTDVSFHGVQDRTWTFGGGDPATSTDAAPLVSYTVPGVHPVQLTVSDGSTTLSTTGTITVLASPGAMVPVSEGFETYDTLGDAPWSVVDHSGDGGFELTTAAAYGGSKSVRLLNGFNTVGQRDELLSHTLDMSDASSIRISFRHAYAQRNTANDDRMRIYVSADCGETWFLRKQLRGLTDLNTGGVVSGSFVPSGPDQWGYTEIVNVGSTFHSGTFRLRFEFQSDGGNNLYLDDININGAPVGMEDAAMDGAPALSVYPNPAGGQAWAEVRSAVACTVRLELFDAMGRLAATVQGATHAGGTQRLELPVEGLDAGTYLLRAWLPDGMVVVRVVLQ
jgi:PKD repeat protein